MKFKIFILKGQVHGFLCFGPLTIMLTLLPNHFPKYKSTGNYLTYFLRLCESGPMAAGSLAAGSRLLFLNVRSHQHDKEKYMLIV